MQPDTKRTWAEINLEHLAHNYQALRGLTPEGCGFVGVVKANAYGHGALPVARKLEELGAEYLAVACLDEAIPLREAGIIAPILIFGPTPVAYAEQLLQYDLTQTISDRETAEIFSKTAVAQGKKLPIHMKLDTGMSRTGFRNTPRGLEEMKLTYQLEGIDCKGIFTHFANADGDPDYTAFQLEGFQKALLDLAEQGVKVSIAHCAASAAVLNYPQSHMDMIRPGISLYGHYPDPGVAKACDLKPVMSLYTRVMAVRTLPKDTCISYGCTHTLARDSKIAVLPVGYGDGYSRLLSNRHCVLIHGQRAPILGRVCMDICMVDVTDIPQVQVGDQVTLYGPGLPVEEAADLVGTIQYELLCAVAPRVPRIYR